MVKKLQQQLTPFEYSGPQLRPRHPKPISKESKSHFKTRHFHKSKSELIMSPTEQFIHEHIE